MHINLDVIVLVTTVYKIPNSFLYSLLYVLPEPLGIRGNTKFSIKDRSPWFNKGLSSCGVSKVLGHLKCNHSTHELMKNKASLCS